MVSFDSSARLSLRLALVATTVVAPLALGACGGSSTTTVTGAPTSTSTAASSTTTGPITTSSTTTSATTSTTTSSGTSTTSSLREAFDTALRKNLVQSQGLNAAQADCVLNELHSTLSDSQIQATVSGQAPKAVTDAAFKAGLKCARP
jgi:hypothetical protein